MNIREILNDWRDGLTHGTILSNSFRVDVGVDVQDYCPVSLNSILEMTANGQVYLGEVGNEKQGHSIRAITHFHGNCFIGCF